MDRKFEPMWVYLTNIKIEVNNNFIIYHVPEIEHQISVIKDIARACYHNLPFKHTPKVIPVDVFMKFSLWPNMFPPKGVVYKSVIPHTIMAGVKFDYNKHCQLKFGQYSQLHQ